MNGIDSRYLLDTNILIYYFNGEAVVQPIVEDILLGRALLNPAMKFGVSAARSAALTPNFIAQISNALGNTSGF